MILHQLTVDPAEFEKRTGWEAKPEGLCKGDACVPAPQVRTPEGQLDVQVLSDRLGMPLVTDEATNTHALGPAGLGRSLTTAVAPELELPDYQSTAGPQPFRLSSLLGRKVLLVAWASW
ncbi:MAG: hypothetical protein HKN03_08765 [Acidimicrobiales bacterium]|nr:hypothetical protein [Acidimicrobiales bacterium]